MTYCHDLIIAYDMAYGHELIFACDNMTRKSVWSNVFV